MSYMRIVGPYELVTEAMKDALEHNCSLFVNRKTKQTVISDSETIYGMQMLVDRNGYYRIGDMYENN